MLLLFTVVFLLEEDNSSILQSLTELLHSIFDFSFSDITDAIKGMFTAFFSWLYDLIFIDLAGFISSAGSKVYSKLFSLFSFENIFSLSTLFFILGMILVIFALKQLISIIRG